MLAGGRRPDSGPRFGIRPRRERFRRPPSGIAPEKGSVLILQRRCIDRILGQARNKSEEAVVEQVNRECWVPRLGGPSSAARGKLLSCERPVTVRVTPAVKRVAGCLGS